MVLFLLLDSTVLLYHIRPCPSVDVRPAFPCTLLQWRDSVYLSGYLGCSSALCVWWAVHKTVCWLSLDAATPVKQTAGIPRIHSSSDSAERNKGLILIDRQSLKIQLKQGGLAGVATFGGAHWEVGFWREEVMFLIGNMQSVWKGRKKQNKQESYVW